MPWAEIVYHKYFRYECFFEKKRSFIDSLKKCILLDTAIQILAHVDAHQK